MICHKFKFAPRMTVKNFTKISCWKQETPKYYRYNYIPPKSHSEQPTTPFPPHSQSYVKCIVRLKPNMSEHHKSNSEASHPLAPLSEVVKLESMIMFDLPPNTERNLHPHNCHCNYSVGIKSLRTHTTSLNVLIYFVLPAHRLISPCPSIPTL